MIKVKPKLGVFGMLLLGIVSLAMMPLLVALFVIRDGIIPLLNGRKIKRAVNRIGQRYFTHDRHTPAAH